MNVRRFIPAALIALGLTYSTATVHAGLIQNDAAAPSGIATTQPIVPESFIRFIDDGHGGGSLQTADVTFENKDHVQVHLVAAVHIGEKSYYEALNKEFSHYDAVLFEMVMPKNMVMPSPADERNAHSDNPISEFQHFLKDALDLDFQLDDIDYTAKNFVHADMDKDTFEKMQEARGETFTDIMLKQMVHAFTDPSAAANQSDAAQFGDLVNILTKPDMERQLKVVLAKQIGDMDATAMGLDGPGGSVIITERNKQAFKVLDQTLAAGKKNIAIFYGGAHMPDMTKRLEAMGFSPEKIDWNMAWDLKIRADQPSAIQKLFDGLSKAMNDDDK